MFDEAIFVEAQPPTSLRWLHPSRLNEDCRVGVNTPPRNDDDAIVPAWKIASSNIRSPRNDNNHFLNVITTKLSFPS